MSTDQATAAPATTGLVDPRAVLNRHVDDLTTRFAGVVSRETIERVVFESYTALGRTAKVKTHVPVLACRFATERLTALAQAKGAWAKDVPEVLFVCVQNAGRSQIAAAYLAHLAKGRVHVRSAGSLPADQVDPVVLQALAEVGLGPAAGVASTDPEELAFPKPLTDDVVQAADVVITMGCGDACPIYPGKRYLDWDVADPAGQDLAVVRAVRDAIARRVSALVEEIAPTAGR
ncbi:Protein-tyrosine-phosphatase [Quadrisphaera granulorum]|uniref:Protein-tyrosine-phosphatase n=1 Tax=Quadrisphaera granulorum TaxID=317664 RepID=A0A316A3H9_9ACTN|nr:arsenate reductase ArsC [Quadrisphaera granulorum]PWJ52536.1 protein-tyrosine-phosphatase [Quadrisphaera granulorum]SZE97586.1 Protein-tyrosine-phosphatase [Quadrisphaera granulorum]